MRPFDWVKIIFGVFFFTLAVAHILALHVPRFGRRAMGPVWPGYITDPALKRVKTRRWTLGAAGYAFLGMGWACRPTVALFTGSDRAATIAGSLSIVAMVLAVVCFLRVFWLDRQL